MDHLALTTDHSNQAADTGSAVHRAAAAYHTNGKDIAAAIATMQHFGKEYPQADLQDAAAQFLGYCQDTRNAEAVFAQAQKRPAVELRHQMEIDGVFIQGTLDQIRVQGGRMYVWDLKSSKKPGLEILHNHIYQVAAYSVLASDFLQEEVHPGGIIRTRAYTEKRNGDAGVFFSYVIDASQARSMINQVVKFVHTIREGGAHAVPGEYCWHCPARSVDICLPKLLELK